MDRSMKNADTNSANLKPLSNAVQAIAKFRAWNTKEKRFETSGIFFSNSAMELQGLPEMVVTHGTGIFDVANNEILVGDLIKDTYTNAVYEVKYGFCKKRAFTGLYLDSHDGLEHALNAGDNSTQNQYVQIIGNIWQNPELLTN